MPHEFYDGIFAEDRRIRGSLRRFARRFVPDQHCGVAGGRAISGGKRRFPLRGGCAFNNCRYADAGRTAARWERHGIGAQELAMHLLDISAAVKSATRNLSDYKRRMALAIRIIVMGANGEEI